MSLNKIRIEKDLSIAKLSELANIPKRTLEDMERRERNGVLSGDIRTFVKLATALNVTLDELCGFEKPTN